ncbi:MAG: hypothetical protein A3F68_09890 [Acidobacteria bacterium RIFCSPLOWO2_12_FULL_54_10]|nr:MAG: hypothetical protein A3F68_09890 [Acidobacteria bacterium RIFCSPLOWO2_12_FULL_54_10]
MPLIPYDKQLEPPDEAEIWRFMDMDKFRDLMANEELYFCRTDLYKKDDPNEGLPTDDYVRRVRGLEKFVLDDELTLNSDQASNRLHSEAFYLNCWSLYDGNNTLRMWYRYAPYGVAIRSRHGHLKSALQVMLDDIHSGKVRYGDGDMTGYNLLQCIYTKGDDYVWENEVRAVLCSYDPVGGQARNYRETNFPHREPQDDINPLHPWVHPCKRRRIHLKELVTGIAVSPWATVDTWNEVERDWAKIRTYNFPVFRDLNSPMTPTIEDLRARGW